MALFRGAKRGTNRIHLIQGSAYSTLAKPEAVKGNVAGPTPLYIETYHIFGQIFAANFYKQLTLDLSLQTITTPLVATSGRQRSRSSYATWKGNVIAIKDILLNIKY